MATVYVRKDAACLNGELIRAGLGGVDVRTKFRYRAVFERIEEEARSAKRGLWAEKQ